jgi:hypothetical protein
VEGRQQEGRHPQEHTHTHNLACMKAHTASRGPAPAHPTPDTFAAQQGTTCRTHQVRVLFREQALLGGHR